MTEAGWGLIGDIGATNARFALVGPDGKSAAARFYALSDHESLSDAIAAYLIETMREAARPVRAVLAVASPVTDDQVTLTNHPWTFSIESVRQQFHLERLLVINDFAANAAALPHLETKDCIQIGGGAPVANAPIGIIGPGSGLGVAGLLKSAPGAITLSGEGGHATMAPATARESAILDLMRKRYDHVSAERVLSGPGLVNLYNVLCEIAGRPAAPYTAEQITSPSIWGEDPYAQETTAIFCAMLGTVAGNLALTLGARGGIYVAGGILPHMASFCAQSEFRSRFEAKGRLRSYMAAIPTYLIVQPLLGLIGANALLSELR